MNAKLLSGRELAAAIKERTAAAAESLRLRGTIPRLAVVTATEDEASWWYVRSIERSASKVGIACDVVDLGPTASQAEVRNTLRKLSDDPFIHGIILQTPLPDQIDVVQLAGAIDPAKDVDGANPLSAGRLIVGEPAFAPATAEAVVALLDHHGVSVSGRHVVVVGRSIVVGKPAAHLLVARDATVTVCHSRTSDLSSHTRGADVLVAAAGRRGIITAEHVRPGATVIDVGTNPDDSGGIVGDVDEVSVAKIAKALTPVPGGVGPVTSMLLLSHTITAALQTVSP